MAKVNGIWCKHIFTNVLIVGGGGGGGVVESIKLRLISRRWVAVVQSSSVLS